MNIQAVREQMSSLADTMDSLDVYSSSWLPNDATDVSIQTNNAYVDSLD